MITLKRTHFLEQGVFGELYNQNNDLICYTLEHSYNLKPKVPSGVYKINYEYSPKFGCLLWELKGVPNCTEIKFHAGNTQEDSDGCILVGLGVNLNNFSLVSSRDAVKKLRNALINFNKYTLEVE